MGVAERCPRCGEESPAEGSGASSEVREVNSGGIIYQEETIRCGCGAVVGSFSHPQNV